MNYQEELEEIEAKINQKKEEKIRLEEKKKRLEEEKNEIISQLVGEGLTAKTLEEEIAKLEQEIQKGINQCREILA